MNNAKLGSALALALISAVGFARAADPAARDWSGLYAGMSAGGGVGGKSEMNFPPDGGAFSIFSPQATGGSLSHSLRGSAWGLRLGENRQFGNLVVGVEGGFDWASIDGTSTNAFGAGTGPTTHKTRLKSLATITPRVGYAMGSWLPYAKAGLALTEVESSMADNAGNTFNRKHLHGGWTAGLGVEYAIASSSAGAWILGLEYNYQQFSGKNYGGQVVPDNTWPVQYNVKPDSQTIMARLTYNFGARGKGSSDAGSSAPGNWNGLYVGLDAGQGFAGKSELNFPPDGGGFGTFSPHATGGSLNHSLRGSAWGFHLGEDRQFGSLVVGLEGGYAWTGIDGTSTNAFGAGTVGPTTHKTSLKSLATLTPRVGYAMGSWLPYAKAGLALTEVESSMAGNGGNTFNQKHLHGGWTAGLGVEYAVAASSAGAWVIGLEYNYYQFSGKNYGGQVVPDNTWPVQYSVKPDSQTILARLSHQFR
jgi:outer membrane immunogenic protein